MRIISTTVWGDIHVPIFVQRNLRTIRMEPSLISWVVWVLYDIAFLCKNFLYVGGFFFLRVEAV